MQPKMPLNGCVVFKVGPLQDGFGFKIGLKQQWVIQTLNLESQPWIDQTLLFSLLVSLSKKQPQRVPPQKGRPGQHPPRGVLRRPWHLIEASPLQGKHLVQGICLN